MNLPQVLVLPWLMTGARGLFCVLGILATRHRRLCREWCSRRVQSKGKCRSVLTVITRLYQRHAHTLGHYR